MVRKTRRESSLESRWAARERKREAKGRSQSRRTLAADLTPSQELQNARRNSASGRRVGWKSGIVDRPSGNMKNDYCPAMSRTLLRTQSGRARHSDRTSSIVEADKRTGAARTLLREQSGRMISATRVAKHTKYDERKGRVELHYY